MPYVEVIWADWRDGKAEPASASVGPSPPKERKRLSVVWFDVDDLLHKLDGPEQWWFAPLIWAAAYAAIVLVLAYYVVGM